jgi:phosphoribosylformylglycinamidine synthase PurS subunit
LKANVIVRLKSQVLDPQGETIRAALDTLGYRNVKEVRQGKHFELSLETTSRQEAESQAREIAERVLSNPVLETFDVEVAD